MNWYSELHWRVLGSRIEPVGSIFKVVKQDYG